MLGYEVIQSENLFYTKGLYEPFGFELEMELDSLTANRCGVEVAQKHFDLLLRKTSGKVNLNLIIEGFSFSEAEDKPSTEEAIYPLTKRRLLVTEGTVGSEYLRMSFGGFRG